MLVADRPFVRQILEIERAVPILAAVKDNRDRLHAVDLTQGEHFEQFVERAEAAGKKDQPLSPQQEVHLANREIAKAETQLGRDVPIRKLRLRQADVQTDGLGLSVVSAAVSRLHDSRPAAGDDGEIALPMYLASRGDQPGKFAGLVVKMTFCHDL